MQTDVPLPIGMVGRVQVHFDSTRALLSDPYHYISRIARALGRDVFTTRFLLQRAVCMTGPDAAAIFVDPGRFRTQGSLPTDLQLLVPGQGEVLLLDGAEPALTGSLPPAMTDPGLIGNLAAVSAQWWARFACRWAAERRIELYRESQELLLRAVCTWAGLPLRDAEVEARCDDFAALIDPAGRPVLRLGRRLLARRRCEVWARGVVEGYRSGPGTGPWLPAASIALSREPDGHLRSPQEAAWEILNLIRTTVGTSAGIVQAAHALHEHPEVRRRIEAEGEPYARLFVREVQRFYPRTPFLVARVRRDFEWRGCRFREGMRAFFDVYGTNHGPIWGDTEIFRPERFEGWPRDEHPAAPGLSVEQCFVCRPSGDLLTTELLVSGVLFLCRGIAYELPMQDVRLEERGMPALPHSRMRLMNIQLPPGGRIRRGEADDELAASL